MIPVMAKRRLTKKQQIAARQKALREEALCRKLSKELEPSKRATVAVTAIPKYEYDDPSQARSLPSAKRAKPTQTGRKRKYDDDPELAAREALAQKEIERKKKRLAPAYSKGPYMLITDDTDPASLGRKN